jgi:glycosyltransferase involved in cell wall biosynthesis
MNPEVETLARKTMKENKVAVFIVAYNAEKHIEAVLNRIPVWVARELVEVYIFDDSSSDNTVSVAQNIKWDGNFARLRVHKTPYNQGYGGNQILGYKYALERKFDIVVLLHGDGQYAPEALPDLLAPYAEGAKVVYGSRFMPAKTALKGGMPLYKFIGNRILTRIQNLTLGTNLSEMHSGYRSYRTDVLAQIPFHLNSRGFDFDADIIGQMAAKKIKITEVPIPTFYGDEICHVNGVSYGLRCIKTVLKYRLMKFNLFFDPKYDITNPGDNYYTVKTSPRTVHHFIRTLHLPSDSSLLDVGGGTGQAVSRFHASKGVKVTCIDQLSPSDDTAGVALHKVDLNRPWNEQFPCGRYDTVLALDVLEHMLKPEETGKELFKVMKSGGKLYASTANVAFFPVRLMLILGHFNYGKRGILDLTHTRLFTIGSFRRYLRNSGFIVKEMAYFGPPIADEFGQSSELIRFLDRVLYKLANFWPGMFAYQIMAICERPDSVEDLMAKMFEEQQAPSK